MSGPSVYDLFDRKADYSLLKCLKFLHSRNDQSIYEGLMKRSDTSVKAGTEVWRSWRLWILFLMQSSESGSHPLTVSEAAFSWVLSLACLSLWVTLGQLCVNTQEPSDAAGEQEEGQQRQVLFAYAGVRLLVLLAVHNLKCMCSVFKKIEASSWKKKSVNFTLDLTVLFLFILFSKSP